MIAAAMKTRSDAAVAYRELARRGAAITRQLAPEALPRWSQAVARGGPVATRLRFSLDADGHAWVHGDFVAQAELRCSRCAQVLESEYAGEVAVCLVADEGQAAELGADRDVVLAPASAVAVADIVEDELLLELPERLCETDPCRRRPSLQFADPVAAPSAAAEEHPFAVLGKLKD